MNDKLIMENYLLVLKSTIEVYIHGTLESSNEKIRTLLKGGLSQTLFHQANTYDEMVKYGWYTITNTQTEKIKQTLSKVKNN